MDKIKEIIRKKLKEISATGQGGATFNAGQGENYATPKAFNKNTNAKGAKNIYYYKLGYFSSAPLVREAISIKSSSLPSL